MLSRLDGDSSSSRCSFFVTQIYDLYNQFMVKLMDNLIAANPVSIGLLDAIQIMQNGNSSVSNA